MPGYKEPAYESQLFRDGSSGALKYGHVDLGTLRQILLTSRGTAEIQRTIIDEMKKLTPQVRARELAKILSDVIERPHLYNDGVAMAVVELLATDPNAEATEGMLTVLPVVAMAAHDRQMAAPRSFREYFYEALLTRRRDTDRTVWDEMIPRLQGDSLVDILADPAARPLVDAIDPFKLIDRLPTEERRKALFSAVFGARAGQGMRALRMLIGGSRR